MAPRFVNNETGVVVNVDEERAAHLDKHWTPLDASAPPPPAVPVVQDVQDVQAEPEPCPDTVQTVEPPPSVEGGSVVSADVQDDAADASEPSEEWTVNDLKAFAQIHGIDLAGAEKKADILARVRAGKTSD